MEKLKPFNESGTCIKCGNDDIHAVYHEKEEYGFGYGAEIIPEHIYRRCRRCGYSWKEACLDSTKRQPADAPS